MNLYLYALGSTLCFSTSSVAFALLSSRYSVLWMNAFKASLATLAFGVSALIAGQQMGASPESLVVFFVSGLLGLNLADFFLFHAYTRIGPARTLMLFSFQPVFLGFASFLLFKQAVHGSHLAALTFMIACGLTMSYENYRKKGHWEIYGILYALLGIVLDGTGILLTRFAFDHSPAIGVWSGNFYRGVGAVVGYLIISRMFPIKFFETFKHMPAQHRLLAILASILGTFLSLTLYLTAIRLGHIASIASVTIAAPFFAATLESFVKQQMPSRYLLVAFLFFAAGFWILIS